VAVPAAGRERAALLAKLRDADCPLSAALGGVLLVQALVQRRLRGRPQDPVSGKCQDSPGQNASSRGASFPERSVKAER
jgi:hypothetical protein